MPVLSVAMPLWIVAGLFVLNTAAVTAGQVRAARRVRDLPSAGRAVATAGALLFLSCAVFALSGTTASAAVATVLLVGGTGLLVLGEMLLAAGGWEIAFTLAPEDKQGQYQGCYAAGVPVARLVGPLLITTLTLSIGQTGWLLLGVVFLLAGTATTRMLRR